MDNKQTLVLEERKSLKVNGVADIASFSEDYLELSTVMGTLCVEGAEMKIEELSRDTGAILIKGEITGVFYNNKSQKKKIFKTK